MIKADNRDNTIGYNNIAIIIMLIVIKSICDINNMCNINARLRDEANKRILYIT